MLRTHIYVFQKFVPKIKRLKETKKEIKKKTPNGVCNLSWFYVCNIKWHVEFSKRDLNLLVRSNRRIIEPIGQVVKQISRRYRNKRTRKINLYENTFADFSTIRNRNWYSMHRQNKTKKKTFCWKCFFLFVRLVIFPLESFRQRKKKNNKNRTHTRKGSWPEKQFMRGKLQSAEPIANRTTNVLSHNI